SSRLFRSNRKKSEERAAKAALFCCAAICTSGRAGPLRESFEQQQPIAPAIRPFESAELGMAARQSKHPAARLAPPTALVPTLFALAIFLIAGLTFAVQPMFTKLVLPRLGGSPSVWSVAMVFFQAALLAGYAYAHLTTRHLPLRAAIVTHLVV